MDEFGRGAIIEVVAGGYIITVMGAPNQVFGRTLEAKQIFTKFSDAFEFLKFHMEDKERDTLGEIERGLNDDDAGLGDDPFPPDPDDGPTHPNTSDT